MIEVALPDRTLSLGWLVLDLNGTLARDGRLCDGVAPRVQLLRTRIGVLLVTGDTYATAGSCARELGVDFEPIGPFEQAHEKRRIVERLGPSEVVVVGNGTNDTLALRAAELGICVLGLEGTSPEALQAADIVAPSGAAALDLLLNPKRLTATLRS